MRAWYRVWQFFRATTARIDERDRAVVAAVLTPALAEVFYRQDVSDQRHALDVYETLRDEGHDDPVLLQAALLHDVGKAVGGIPIPYRVANVLIRAVRPGWLSRLAAPDPHSWRYPFYVYDQHPARGSDLIQTVGADPAVVGLIRRHHEPGEDRSALILRRADDAC